MYEKSEFDSRALIQLAEKTGPDLLYVSGWSDPDCLRVASAFKRENKPVVCAFDNQWRGTIRQRVASILSPWLIHTRFSHAWVPGSRQVEFARKLGFPANRIHTGMYSADTLIFQNSFEETRLLKTASYPRRFLCVARLVESKGIPDLLQAYKKYQNVTENPWKLRIAGSGNLSESVRRAAGVEYMEFVQPGDLAELSRDSGALILPSRFEPWGVVLHEFSSAGLPLIASTACGAAVELIAPGENGFLHRPGDPEDLLLQMKKISALDNNTLLYMSGRSREISSKYSPDIWADTLVSIAEKN